MITRYSPPVLGGVPEGGGGYVKQRMYFFQLN